MCEDHSAPTQRAILHGGGGYRSGRRGRAAGQAVEAAAAALISPRRYGRWHERLFDGHAHPFVVLRAERLDGTPLFLGPPQCGGRWLAGRPLPPGVRYRVTGPALISRLSRDGVALG